MNGVGLLDMPPLLQGAKMSDCFCTKTYQCLACEKADKAVRIITRRTRISQARKVAVCGTRAGYNKHLRLGEPTCADCREAQTIAVKRYQLKASHANTAE